MLTNFKLNTLSLDNSFLIAASDGSGSARFKTLTHIRQHTQGGSLSEDGNHNVKKNKLDDFNLKNQKVGCIKIDTEGHEHEVLMGSENIIHSSKPEVIFELNAGAQNCINFLIKYGYYFFIIDDENNKLIPISKDKTKLKLRKEGTNCLATINPSSQLFAKYVI